MDTGNAVESLECTLAALVFSLNEVFERLEKGALDEKEAEEIDDLAVRLHTACASLATGSPRKRR